MLAALLCDAFSLPQQALQLPDFSLTACWCMCLAQRSLLCKAGGSGLCPDPFAGCQCHTVLHATANDKLWPPASQATWGSRKHAHVACTPASASQEQLPGAVATTPVQAATCT